MWSLKTYAKVIWPWFIWHTTHLYSTIYDADKTNKKILDQIYDEIFVDSLIKEETNKNLIQDINILISTNIEQTYNDRIIEGHDAT